MSILPAIVEVAIGAVLIFLTLSAICSTLADLLSNLFNLRSRYLFQGIVALLADPAETRRLLAEPLPQGELVTEVMTNPLLQKLDAGKKESRVVRWVRGNQPSSTLVPEVPPDLFASVVVDSLRRRSPNYGSRLTGMRMRVQALAATLNRGATGDTSPIPPVVLDAIQQRDARQAADQIRQALPLITDPGVRAAVTNMLNELELEQIRQGIGSLPSSRVRAALLTLLNEAESQERKVEQFQKRLAEWFDNGMTQVSGWYKAHIHLILRGLAVVVCLAVNADILHAVDVLWREPATREALVVQAQMVSREPAPTYNIARTQVTSTSSDPVRDFVSEVQQLRGLPVGWNCDEVNSIARDGSHVVLIDSDPIVKPGLCQLSTRVTTDGQVEKELVLGGNFSLRNFLLKLAGLALMSLGVSFGAGFWYKLLRQLLNLRPGQ